MDNCIELPPAMLDAYKQIKLPIQTIDDITGVDSNLIVLFSDYGPITTKYETYAYYLTDGRNIPILNSLLRGVKQLKGIAGQTIQYKDRKNPFKRKAFPKWIETIRNYPGLLYIVAFDTRLEKQLYIKPEKKAFKAQLESSGLPDKLDIYKRMIRAAGFIVALLPYFRSKHKLLWITDNDDIFMTAHRREAFEDSVRTLVYKAGGSQLAKFDIYFPQNEPESKEFDDNCEQFLSIPDIAASSFGNSLDYDQNDRFKYPDTEAAEILQELARITDLVDYRIERRLYCTMGNSIFEFQQTEGKKTQYFHNCLHLSPRMPNVSFTEGVEERIYIKGYK